MSGGNSLNSRDDEVSHKTTTRGHRPANAKMDNCALGCQKGLMKQLRAPFFNIRVTYRTRGTSAERHGTPLVFARKPTVSPRAELSVANRFRRVSYT